MNDNFSFSELYDVKLKTTYPMKINNRDYEVGEVITTFDKILISNIREIKPKFVAEGGFDNRAHVIWDDTKEIEFSFSQGVFSKLQLSMLGNSRLLEKEPNQSILISQREVKETDEEGKIDLKEIPASLFVYDEDGNKIKDYGVEGKTLVFSNPYKTYIIDYQFKYINKYDNMIIGRKLISGFISLEGRTRVKEDITGIEKTGIFYIPRLKLMSDLSIRLGENANPVIANFRASGFPIGDKGTRKIMELVFLDEDIDSDM